MPSATFWTPRGQAHRLTEPMRHNGSITYMKLVTTMNALSMIIRPIRHGWAVQLSDGRELASFHGPGSQRRALRYLANAAEALTRGPRNAAGLT